MTRVLSELLGAREPLFQQSLKQLEILAGHPGADIRLSSSLQQALRGKLHELQLDAHDTTGPELYAALGQRLRIDDQRFEQAIRSSAASIAQTSEDITQQLARVLQNDIAPARSFALKSTAAKKILRAHLPRKTMKALGYRSSESMLKHESAASLYAAAWLIESPQWTKRILAAYTKLAASDFEQRPLTLEYPASKRWQTLSESVVAVQKHHVLSFKELGSVVMLPLPVNKPQLSTLTTAVLVLHAVNEIRAAGTFMKLHQMQSNFGGIVQQVVYGEPMLPSLSLDEPVSWHSLHQYFARFGSSVRSDIFEPMIAAPELAWTTVEDALAKIEPSLHFWQGSQHLGMISGAHAVSCNLTDALLSHCNQLPFDNRVVQYFKQSLRSELLLQYLSHHKLEEAVLGGLQRKLAPEMALS
ncbi:MAG TPA: hypothetical protein VF575_02120 [Candidatus Saccharimonadales bacterium]|jgi:hypothetical protein